MRLAMVADNWPRLAQFARWMRSPHLAGRLALLLTGAAIVSSLATYVLISGSPPYGPDVRTVVVLLNLDLILLLLLGIVVARRLVQLWLAARQGSAGSRLHVRAVVLFGLLAATPAIIVAVFSVLFLNFGIESWFSERVRSALDNSMNVARAYLEEHKEIIRADALAMANDLNRESGTFLQDPQLFQTLVNAQTSLRSLTEAMVFRSNGQVIARSQLSFTLVEERLSTDVLEQAVDGEVVVLTSDSDDRVHALVRLDAFVDAYLFVGRFVDPRVLNYMDLTQQAVDEYSRMESERSGIQITFALIFGIVALLLVLAAIWVGLSFANRLVAPIGRLIGAADRIRAGDLTARVPEGVDKDELASLSRAFNRMTSQLASQRRELIEANQQLDQRRRFTEAVVRGVSAGVLGLDPDGLITLANQSAAEFFGAEQEEFIGRPISDMIPAAEELLSQLRQHPERAVQRQVDLHQNSRDHTLLLRVSAQLRSTNITGFVATFDDISELLAAQRQAAWAEVAQRIAHEIKNPLTPIQLSAERLKRKYLKEIKSDPETFRGCTDTIVQQVEGIGRLINEFSAFARMPRPVFHDHEAAELIGQAVELQRTARPEISFSVQLPDHDVRLYCDAHKVAQALTNLLQNAVDSLTDPADSSSCPLHGTIVVRLFDQSTGPAIEVCDSGGGLPEGDTRRLSEPYVTTRTKGTGLGLAIVKKIMEEHGGDLLLANRPEGGASAKLVFPSVPAVQPLAG